MTTFFASEAAVCRRGSIALGRDLSRDVLCLMLAPDRELIRLCVLLLLLLVGCAAPRGMFQTKNDSSYQSKVERVLIVYPKQNADADPALAAPLEQGQPGYSSKLVRDAAGTAREK